MKQFAVTCLSLILFASGLIAQIDDPMGGAPQPKKMFHLEVMDNNRYLQMENGTPFFYLGDTAWELFHRLDKAEAEEYLSDRAEKGFTVIQAVVLPQLGGIEAPNAYNELPLIDRDPTQPNEEYFAHIDYIVDMAESLGMYVGMLPTWGSHWKAYSPSDNPIFNSRNARIYGEFLGDRYRDDPIIWILGGDANIEIREERRIIESMAKGIQKGDGGAHLITFHPRGPGQSSDFFHTADWLDFNMFQSSHGAHDHDNGLFAEEDYARTPRKPTLDGEPRYENIVVGFYFDGADPKDRFDDFDVRQAAYWSLLAGACGYTYGNNNIWQMYEPVHQPVIWAEVPWDEALDHPGAFQMKFVRELFEARPFWKLIPDQSMILDGLISGGAKIRAARDQDSSFAFIYSPYGEPFTVSRDVINSHQVRETWYNPKYGTSYAVHTGDNTGIQTYTPPTSGRGNDWILILDDADKQFPIPGESPR